MRSNSDYIGLTTIFYTDCLFKPKAGMILQGSQQSGILEKPAIVMGFFFCHGNPAKPWIVMGFCPSQMLRTLYFSMVAHAR